MTITTRGTNNGESWRDVRLNDAIILQTLGTSTLTRSFDTPMWMLEMISRRLEPEVAMVTGMRAYQASCLFALENRRVIERNDCRIEWLWGWYREMREIREDVCILKEEQWVLKGTNKRLQRRLVDWVKWSICD